MGQIELVDHLTVGKQITDVKLNCVILQYLEKFNYVQTNELCWIELLVLNNNTWNRSMVWNNWIIGIT